MHFIEDDYLWRLVVGVKYSKARGDWIFKEVRKPYGCSPWRGIRGVGRNLLLSFFLWQGMVRESDFDMICSVENWLWRIFFLIFLIAKNKDADVFLGSRGMIGMFLDSWILWAFLYWSWNWLIFVCTCSSPIFQLLVELIVWDGSWTIMENLWFSLTMKRQKDLRNFLGRVFGVNAFYFL